MPQSTRREFVAGSGGTAAVLSGFAGVPFAIHAAQAPPARRLLSSRYTPEKIAAVLLPRANWKPFPAIADRAGWEALPQEARAVALKAGERHLGADWPTLPATLFLEFVRNGNRSHYERVRDTRRGQLRDLVIAECTEGKGRFIDDIVNGIWTTCEETYWGVPAHVGMQKAGSGLPDAAEPTVDLFAGETAALLSWTDYLLGLELDKVSPLVRERIAMEMDRRVLTPCLKRDDFWWMGLGPNVNRKMNNWNPWVNSNWLTSVLLLERDNGRRVAAVHKILRSLDRFLDSYDEDGGCDEGPGYWGRAGGSLFDCLELLHSACDGAINFYDVPLVGEIGRYIYRAHIYDDYFVNFGDASARNRIDGDLVFRYGRRIADEKMQALGAFAAQERSAGRRGGGSIGRELPALFNLAVLSSAPASQPLVRDVWLPGIQVMAARLKEGSAQGLYLAAQGGHNGQSHNHNDVGNFIVYADGQPAIIDIGVETYSAKTFSSQRYDIWTMQSAYHNLPTINGVMQAAGREFAATDVVYRADDSSAEFSLDIARAYPREAGLRSWKRTVQLDRARNRVSLHDSYDLQKPAEQITFTLMTASKVMQPASGQLILDGPARVKILYDASLLRASTEEIPIQDARLKYAWGDRLCRILLRTDKPPARGEFSLAIVQDKTT